MHVPRGPLSRLLVLSPLYMQWGASNDIFHNNPQVHDIKSRVILPNAFLRMKE
jgi:hypothetical protein